VWWHGPLDPSASPLITTPLNHVRKCVQNTRWCSERWKACHSLTLYCFATVATVGHVGDGNFHCSIRCSHGNEDELTRAKTLADTISTSVAVDLNQLLVLLTSRAILFCIKTLHAIHCCYSMTVYVPRMRQCPLNYVKSLITLSVP